MTHTNNTSNIEQEPPAELEQQFRAITFEIAKIGQEVSNEYWHKMEKPLRERLDIKAYELIAMFERLYLQRIEAAKPVISVPTFGGLKLYKDNSGADIWNAAINQYYNNLTDPTIQKSRTVQEGENK